MAGRESVASGADTPLVLRTLGGTELARPTADNGPTPLLSSGKPLALLVYLASSPDHTASRDHLCDLLWADLEPDAARHALRQTVWYLRQRLGGDALALDRDSQLTLAVPIPSDRDAFLCAIEKGDLECAVALYTGDFVPDYAAPGGAEFEQWADLERFRLRLQFLRAGEQLVRRWLSQARFREAQHLARRLRDADPARESGWRLVIESLLSSDDRLGGAVEAEGLKRWLAAENREPEPATRSLLRDAVDEPANSSARTDTAPRLVAELVGRGKEFAVVMEAWEAARRGKGLHLHIHGAAGIGKTRLLEDVLARLHAQGVRPLLLRAKPGERQIEYAFASDLAGALCAQSGAAGISPASAATLVALNPALSSRFAVQPDRFTGADALRRRAIALCETIAAVADDHPLALLLDDLHWSDVASRRVLQVMLDRLSGQPVLVVTAARPGIEESLGETSQTLTLEPLSPEEVSAFIASLAALPETPWATRLPGLLHGATGGTPLLLVNNLEWLLQRDLLQRSESVWTCRDVRALESELAAGSAMRRRIADLARRPGWLLLLLSEIGTPISRDHLASMAGLSDAEVEEALATLELRGLARRRGEEWEPAHDEIAESARAEASGEAIRAANAAVGRVLAQGAGKDPHALFKAGRHLAVAGDDSLLSRVFRRWLMIARREGERRTTRALAAELLGNGRTGDRVGRLLKALPLHVRLGLTTTRRTVAAAAVPLLLAGAAGAFFLRPPESTPDAVLVLYRSGTGDSLSAVAIPVRREGWERSGTIDVARAGSPYRVLARAGGRGGLSPSPDGTRWAFGRLVPESSAVKLFVVGPDASPREVTDSIRDDYDAGWSPDGRRLVFSTERWNENRWADIATVDLGSRRVRRLTMDPQTETSARWSPDGTRIAFLRQRATQGAEICWTTPAGDPAVCLPVRGTGLIGWSGANQLLIRHDSAERSIIARYDIDTHENHTVWQGGTSEVVISDNGRWIACRCQPGGFDKEAWLVFPADRPDLARRLDWSETQTGRRGFAVWVGGRTASYIARLDITAPADSIPLGSGFQLHAQGQDTSGALLPTPILTWRSADSTVATVDESTGVVRPIRAGDVTIVATAGGWRSTRHRFTIVPHLFHPLFNEAWVDLRQWTLYGDPQPTLATGPQGVRSFWNRGDGWNMSGAHSTRSFLPRSGLGIEARVSTPVVGPRQQFVTISLAAWADSETLSRRDQSVDNQPPPEIACVATYPAETADNPATRGDLAFDGRLIPLPADVRSRTWYSIRLQLFPDGRCGVEVDGNVMAIEDASLPLDLPYYAVLEGNSLGNRMLVGPLEVWEGVRDGVDWSAVKPRYFPP